MGELPDQRPATGNFEPFAERWFAPLVGVFLRSVRHPAVAYDLAGMDPPPHIPTEIHLSGLVEADPLPDHDCAPHGT